MTLQLIGQLLTTDNRLLYEFVQLKDDPDLNPTITQTYHSKKTKIGFTYDRMSDDQSMVSS